MGTTGHKIAQMNLKCTLQRLEADLSGYKLGASFCCDSLDNTEHSASQSRLADPGAGMEVLWQEAAGCCVDRVNCMLLETLRTGIQWVNHCTQHTPVKL